jgi:hypothetical protein
LADLDAWGEEFRDAHLLLGDADRVVWDQYITALGKPQFFVIDRDMTIVNWGKGGDGSEAAEQAVLDLLENE